MGSRVVDNHGLFGVRSMELLLAKRLRVEDGAHAIMYINIWTCFTALKGVGQALGLDRYLELVQIHVLSPITAGAK